MSVSSASRIRSSRLRLPLAASLVGAILIWPEAGIAQSNSPFAKFSGSWRGSGQVVGADGKHERISCRATYVISEEGKALSQSLVCASDSYRFDVRSDVAAEGENVRGQWQETTRNAMGNLVGQIADGDFQGSIGGSGFTAEMSLRMNGRKQEVNISPHGGDVAEVNIVLSREK